MTPRQRQLSTWWCSLNNFEVPSDPELAAWARSVGLPLPEVTDDVHRGRVESEAFRRYSRFQARLAVAAGGRGNTLIVWNEQLERNRADAGIAPRRRPDWLQALFDRDRDPRNTADDLLDRRLDLEVDGAYGTVRYLDTGGGGEGFLFQRTLDDGRLVAVMPLLFGRARLGIGPAGVQWFSDVWDFPTVGRAIAEATSWNPEADPEPVGWHRHVATGRYRPDGDATREYTKKR